jgi:predicted alpha/beta superfamily hydrolase
MRHSLAAVLVVGLALASAAPALAEPMTIVSENPPLPPSYQRYVLRSDRLGRDFAITVNTPQATAFLPGQKFPTIYALDSGYGFAGLQGRLLGGAGAMAPAIIVSVGYPPGQATFRNTDLLHNRMQPPPYPSGQTAMGGGGKAFEAFLLEDLKPFIEAKYPADPKRAVLFGHSFGGLFAARVFADNPDAFAGWIIGSPSVWADPEVAAAVGRAAAKAKAARVYLTVGEFEDGTAPGVELRMRDGYKALGDALKNRPGVTLKAQMYMSEGHLSYYPRLVTDGFPHVLPPLRPQNFQDRPLADAAIGRYVGDYLLPDGRKLTVRLRKLPFAPQGLEVQVTGLAPELLMAVGQDHFYWSGADLRATFDGAGLTMAGGGAKMRAEKVKGTP